MFRNRILLGAIVAGLAGSLAGCAPVGYAGYGGYGGPVVYSGGYYGGYGGPVYAGGYYGGGGYYRRPVPAGRACRTCGGPVLCRFLDAGMTRDASCSGGRRPKSARARSRGKFGRRAGGRRYGDLIFVPVMMVGAKVAPGDLDRVRKGSGKHAMGISVAA
jgi:hypothetical protein